MKDARALELLKLSTTALHAIYVVGSDARIAAADGETGLATLLKQTVTHLRGIGYDDQGEWNTIDTQDIPVAPGGGEGDADDKLLANAATAMRDFDVGYARELVFSISGEGGLRELVRELVTELRGRGVDDEGAWDAPETIDIPVAGRGGPRP